MIVFFSSATENTSRFVQKLDLPALRIPLRTTDTAPQITEPFVLITPTYGAGGKRFVPVQVVKLLNVEAVRNLCVGVIGSGNKNFYEDYTKAADIISAKLQVPVLYRFELAGTDEDVSIVTKGLNEFWQKSLKRVPSL